MKKWLFVLFVFALSCAERDELDSLEEGELVIHEDPSNGVDQSTVNFDYLVNTLEYTGWLSKDQVDNLQGDDQKLRSTLLSNFESRVGSSIAKIQDIPSNIELVGYVLSYDFLVEPSANSRNGLSGMSLEEIRSAMVSENLEETDYTEEYLNQRGLFELYKMASERRLIRRLKSWLKKPVDSREPLESLNFSKAPLTKWQAKKVKALLYKDKQQSMLETYEQQWTDRELTFDGYQMPFYYQIFGDEPADGRSLFISMHGGGGTTSDVNDQQYENQKHLYDEQMESLEGVYLAPRAPTNTWNLWHQNHIDDLFNIIIQMATVMENVNPNKVYIMGYSAGGDGVYQLAPRMADRWAAAAMSAGHPNETSPLGLKNLPFALHMGADDTGYDRNLRAAEWGVMLDDLENSFPGTYIHDVQIHEGLGHWMNLEDAVALPWMKNYQRNAIPTSLVWLQDDRHHSSFYWLGTPEGYVETGGTIEAEYNRESNEINIVSNYSDNIELYINDDMLNLDESVVVKYQGNIIGEGVFDRTVLSIYETLASKGDVNLSFSSVVSVLNNEHIEE